MDFARRPVQQALTFLGGALRGKFGKKQGHSMGGYGPSPAYTLPECMMPKWNRASRYHPPAGGGGGGERGAGRR